MAQWDEPYVIVFTGDLRRDLGAVILPKVKVTVTGPWNTGEGHTADTIPLLAGFPADEPPACEEGFQILRWPCWGMNGKLAPIEKPDDVVIIAAMMENDDADPAASGQQ